MPLAYWANVIGYCTSLLPGKIMLSLPSLCGSWVCCFHHFISMCQLDICMMLKGENKLTVKNVYNYNEIIVLWCHTAGFLHSLCMNPKLTYQLKNIIHSMTMSTASNKSSVSLLAFYNSKHKLTHFHIHFLGIYFASVCIFGCHPKLTTSPLVFSNSPNANTATTNTLMMNEQNKATHDSMKK
jgi:hypothetical protein